MDKDYVRSSAIDELNTCGAKIDKQIIVENLICRAIHTRSPVLETSQLL